MHKFFTLSFWVQLFLSTFMTMLMIYLIKRINEKTNIPVVSDIVKGV